MPIEYKYIPLIKPTVIDRRYKKDIQPPQLVQASNCLVSRSDDALAIRPDFNVIDEELLARSSGMYFGVSDSVDDFLNSAHGMWGSDTVVYFTRFLPGTATDAAFTEIADNYTTGTDVSCTAGGTTLTGVGATAWLSKIWPGCVLEVHGDGKYYLVKSITDDTHLEITGEFQTSHANKQYIIYRSHCAFNADYKLNVQAHAGSSSSMLYNAPSITEPLNEINIHGPLSNTASTSSTTTTYDIQSQTDADITEDAGTVYQRKVVRGNGIYIIVPEAAAVVGESFIWVSTTTPDCTSNPWTKVDLATFDTGGYSTKMGTIHNISFDGTRFWACGRNQSNNFEVVLQSTNGTTWSPVTPLVSNGSSAIICGNGSILVLVVGSLYVRYSTDNGTTWSSGTGFGSTPTPSDCVWGGGYFVASTSSDVVYYSTDGITWTSGVPGAAGARTIAYSSKLDRWVIASDEPKAYADGTPATANWTTIAPGAAGDQEFIDFVDDKFWCVSDNNSLVYSADGIAWSSADISGETGYVAGGKWLGTFYHNGSTFVVGVDEGTTVIMSCKVIQTVETTWTQGDFTPISDLYRASSFASFNGYVILIGTREWSGSAWVYFPRRIRWTAPATTTDFTTTGSGTADLTGVGALLDCRVVNDRLVTFESTSIGAISPRGFVDDPWDYEVIKSGIKILSNPVVVGDVCFFISQDGLLWQTDGVRVEETGSSVDVTSHTDYDETKPIWLVYSSDINCLVAYRKTTSKPYTAHIINLNNGSVTAIDLFEATTSLLSPKSIVSIEGSHDTRLMVGFGATSADTDSLVTMQLDPGDIITGLDEPTTTAADDNYWFSDVRTGEIQLTPEGDKVSLPHIIVETYTEATSGTNADRPDLVVQVKSSEDSDWTDRGSSAGTITVTTTTCTGSGTAFSNLIGRAGEEVTGSEDEFTLPCQASQARVYTELSGTYTPETAYTTSGNTITFTTDPLVTKNLYAFWDGYPEVSVAVGDYIEHSDGWSRITAINTATNLTLDHYVAVGQDATATHHPAEQMPDGEDEIKIGIHKLVDSVQVRFVIIPRSDGTNQSTTAKITGFSIGYRPHGKRVLEATGT